jgi:hypothetical protein
MTTNLRSEQLRRERLQTKLATARRPAFFPVLETGDGEPGDDKLGGTPLGEVPICKGCRCPMVLLLQLDPRRLPAGAPGQGKGPLQVFHCGRHDCDYGDVTHSPGGTGVVMRVAVEPKTAKASAAKSTTEAAPKPAKKGKAKAVQAVGKGKASRIVGWTEASDLPGPGDLTALALDAKEQRLAADERSRDGDKLGGYPCWIQHPTAPDCPTCHAPMHFVFQLSARLVDFGDSGLGYLHQCGKHPAKLAFSWSST